MVLYRDRDGESWTGMPGETDLSIVHIDRIVSSSERRGSSRIHVLAKRVDWMETISQLEEARRDLSCGISRR